jgi:anti-sigma B factor antagonist
VSRAVFHLQTQDSDGAPTPAAVTVTGEVDASNVAEFRRSVLELPGARPFILELSRIKYLDSAGFAALDQLLAENAILMVLSPDSLMYRTARAEPYSTSSMASPSSSRSLLWWLLASR